MKNVLFKNPSINKIGVGAIVINKEGERLARRLKSDLEGIKVIKAKSADNKKGSLQEIVSKAFHEYDGIIFFAALGIVVRLISPFIKSKHSDPAVVCVDTAGRFAISILSGHEGRANQLAYKVATSIDCEPVITTGSEVHRKFIIGIGLRKGVSKKAVKEAIGSVLESLGIGKEEVRLVASVDIKKRENGLIRACSEEGFPLLFISRDRIQKFKGDISHSEIVNRNLGVGGVCEPCALLAGRRTRLVLKKQILNGVTVAVARES